MDPVERLHHVSVCVTDIDRARRFYGEVLGLVEVARPHFGFGGAWYEFPDGTQLHLIVHERPLSLRGTTTIDVRDGHLALRVKSYEVTPAHLKAEGVEVVALRQNKTPWAQIYVTDPDGNIVELNAERE
jgi:catechol 2,3-dioxygenase-like lactoylglutathione lyase family enzyme